MRAFSFHVFNEDLVLSHVKRVRYLIKQIKSLDTGTKRMREASCTCNMTKEEKK